MSCQSYPRLNNSLPHLATIASPAINLPIVSISRLSSSGVSELRLLDLRSPYERQTDGFVEGSEMVNATALFRGDKDGKQFRYEMYIALPHKK